MGGVQSTEEYRRVQKGTERYRRVWKGMEGYLNLFHRHVKKNMYHRLQSTEYRVKGYDYTVQSSTYRVHCTLSGTPVYLIMIKTVLLEVYHGAGEILNS